MATNYLPNFPDSTLNVFHLIDPRYLHFLEAPALFHRRGGVDRAGRSAAWKAVEAVLTRMKDGRQAFFLFLPDGEDPVNGGPFMQHVVEGLTNPLQDEDLNGVSFDRSAPRLLDPDTEDNLHRRFRDNGWTD